MAQQRMTDQAQRVQGGAQALWNRLMHFFREVRGEFNRVNWPSRAELTALTVLVLVLVFLLAIYIGGVDIGLQQAVRWLLR